MSKLSLCEIQQSQLDKTPIVDGQLVCCLDTGNTYRDTAGGRVRIGSDLERVSELPLAPLAGKIYYLPPGDLYIYNSGWVMLNDTDFIIGVSKADATEANLELKHGDMVKGTVKVRGTGITSVTADADGRLIINTPNPKVVNNLTSDSTTDSLSAAQGKALKTLVDGKAAVNHTHSQYYDSTISRTKGTVLAAPASANGVATFRTLTKSDVGLGSVDNTADSAKSVKYATSAGSATKATNDAKDQAITSYIRGLSVSGRTITFTKGDGTTDTITTQDTNTTYSSMTAATANAAGSTGLVPAPSAGSQVKYLRGDGTWSTPTNTTYSAFKGATSSAAGGAGLVPAPGTGNVNQYLKGDGTWGTPSNTWRGIQNNLTSDSTNDSLAAAQGKALKALIDGKAASSHTHTKSQITDFPALGTAAVKNVRTLTAQGASGWEDAATDQQYVPDMSFIAYWNGAYSGTSSNLTYCNRGAFGTIVTKNTSDYAVAGHTHTWDSVTGKPSTFTPSSHTHNYAGSSSAGGAATSANKVNAALTINLNGTSQGAWDGSSAKSISITAASVGATSVTISRW